MPPGRFRKMAQRNMIRRDCAFAEKFIAERRVGRRRKVVADRSKETAEVKGCDQGMSQRGVRWMELF